MSGPQKNSLMWRLVHLDPGETTYLGVPDGMPALTLQQRVQSVLHKMKQKPEWQGRAYEQETLICVTTDARECFKILRVRRVS